MVSISEFGSGDSGSFHGRAKYLFFNSDIVDFLFKTNGERDRSNSVIFEVWSALIVGGWVVIVKSRKPYLEPAVFLLLFKDGGRRVGPKFHLLVLFIKKMRKLGEFKIFLRELRDEKILPRSSASC